MLKITLYGAVAGGLLAAVATANPAAAAAPTTSVAPQVEQNVNDVRDRRWRRHHRRYHDHGYYYYGPRYHYYQPGPGIYFRAW